MGSWERPSAHNDEPPVQPEPSYPLIPPGVYKVRKCGDDPRGLEITTGDYTGHRLRLPSEFEMPTSDALVHIAVVKAERRVQSEQPRDYIKELTNRNPLSGYERMILRSIALVLRLLLSKGGAKYAPDDIHDARYCIVDLERGANV